MSLTPDIESDLRRLFRHARGQRGQFPGLADPDAASRWRAGPSGVRYVISDDYLALARSLRRRIVGASRHDQGFSPTAVENLLYAACDEAVGGTIKDAVAHLHEALNAPVTRWSIAENVDILFPGTRLRVGGATYAKTWPRHLALTHPVSLDRMRLPVVFTAVYARDHETARILAAERFAQSAAILDLIFPPSLLAGREMLVEGDHAHGISSIRDTWIIRHTSGTQLAEPLADWRGPQDAYDRPTGNVDFSPPLVGTLGQLAVPIQPSGSRV